MIDKNKYVELLNATVNDVNFEHIKQLITYIQENKPKSLFRYRRCSEQSIEAFRENNIFFNTASNFNDPYAINVPNGKIIRLVLVGRKLCCCLFYIQIKDMMQQII